MEVNNIDLNSNKNNVHVVLGIMEVNIIDLNSNKTMYMMS